MALVRVVPLVRVLAASDKANGDVVNFQVDTAIEVLRDAGYLDEGLYLAKKHGEHDW